MSGIFNDQEEIFNYFSLKCEEILKEATEQFESIIAPINAKEKKEKLNADRLKVIAESLKKVILYILGGGDESNKEGVLYTNYEIIPDLFHKFIMFYITNKNIFLEILPNLNFNWIYEKFRIINEDSNHFKIHKETLDFLKKEFLLENFETGWFEINLLKSNYQELSSDDTEYFSLLRILILLVLRFEKRKIRDIRFQ